MQHNQTAVRVRATTDGRSEIIRGQLTAVRICRDRQGANIQPMAQ
jgi:hypothetical protein